MARVWAMGDLASHQATRYQHVWPPSMAAAALVVHDCRIASVNTPKRIETINEFLHDRAMS